MYNHGFGNLEVEGRDCSTLLEGFSFPFPVKSDDGLQCKMTTQCSKYDVSLDHFSCMIHCNGNMDDNIKINIGPPNRHFVTFKFNHVLNNGETHVTPPCRGHAEEYRLPYTASGVMWCCQWSSIRLKKTSS
ncbi:unnamed protein product [Lactuca saligna]|uniref:Uncharacterized protein n=1 Tax=Lactuca saligna TaxID=75948 RepID=A0AA35YXJ2_LACSI|nr:unnamed protein product [Lactuca saligna]